MFNFSSLVSFFKKKPVAEPEIKAHEPAAEKKIQIDNLAIHTMPERFRRQPVKASSAKNASILIMVGGIIVLAAASALLYYYLFKKPAATIEPPAPVATATPTPEANQIPPEIQPGPTDLATSTATTTEPIVLPTDNGLATSTAAATPETLAPGEPTLGLIPALDSDNDGLTDAEEIILRTGTSTPDTDSDGYLDGVELLNLYDPAGPGRLASSTELAAYKNKNFNYSALYPSAWQLTVNGGDDSIMFKTADNQFFQIVVQANTGQEPLDQWYMEQLDEAAINDSNRLSGANWQGIKNLDGLTLYLMDAGQKYIFTLAYNPGENNILDYINIFDMIIKSFILGAPAPDNEPG